MKTFLTALLTTTVTLTLAATAASAAGPTSQGAIALGLRSHSAHSVFQDYPFDDGDLSYGIAYEYHEDAAYWQLGLDYTADASRTNTVDTVLTPQLNLVFKDRLWRGGVGILSSYITYSSDDPADKDDWTDIYYQFLLGISIPAGAVAIDVMAAYPFGDWGDLGDFEVGDIEVQGWVKYLF